MPFPRARRTSHLLPLALVVLVVRCQGKPIPSGEAAPNPPAPPATAPGVYGVYYVAPGGSDRGPGSRSQPWGTLTHALARLSPGDSLYVRGGRYTENVRPAIRPGRPDARITVAAYPGERPVVVGLLWLARPSYWTLDGVDVTWNPANRSTSHMVKLTDGVGWVLQNSELWGARSYAALLVAGTTAGEPAGWVVRGNCVHDTHAANDVSQDHNLYINTGTAAGSGLIERNVIFNAPNGTNVKLGYGRSRPQPGDGAANVTVRYNTLYGAARNLAVTDESRGNTIERNIVVNSTAGYFIRAYRLRDASNVYRENAFHGAARIQYGDAGYLLLTDGGGNRFPLDPRFDGVGCDAFRPSNAAARDFGRHAR